MKMKISLMVLPLLCAAGLASAQGADPAAAAAPSAVQTPDMQGQRQGEVRDSHDRYRGKPRQGRDMRRCLNLKTDAAIIRCAEPGRKP
jgi:hypothetical protein